MPDFDTFRTDIDYYSVLAHEIIHWTGADQRLNRKLSQERQSYAFEELVAELGSAAGRADAGSAKSDSARDGAPAAYLLIRWLQRALVWAGPRLFFVDVSKIIASINTLANPAPPPHQSSPRVRTTADASNETQRPGHTRDSAKETPETPGPKGRP